MTRRDPISMANAPDAGLSGAALLRLLQLCSPALPIGAFAYSHGLEQAVSLGWVRDAAETEGWIGGLLDHAWTRLEVPLLARLYAALADGDDAALATGGQDAFAYWCGLSRASRESAELAAEDLHLGSALASLMASFGVPRAGEWAKAPVPFAAVLAAVTLHWGLSLRDSALALLWTLTEHQVAAAVKLVPLGQTAGQLLLQRLAARIPAAVEQGLALKDEEIGAISPGLALASALHETLYSRLFRS
jgi:urease accessory protein